ncbi:hypothetical protein LTR50_006535 [Elasticomyces elasticus]|nr:hypothetical protein LTR50_006535 [Elasticomyces elasticus]
MPGLRQMHAFRHDRDLNGNPMTVSERERLIQTYLPPTPTTRSPSHSPTRAPKTRRKQPIREFLRNALHLLVFTVIQFTFSVYIRFRKAYHAVVDRILAILYYHHRTPELIQRDVRKLSKLPHHLSVILEFPEDGRSGNGLESLVNDVCEVVAWSACAGIPVLSIYERTGVLKSSLPHLHRRISRHLTSYFGTSSPHKPTLSIRAPHLPSYSPPTSPGSSSPSRHQKHHISVLLLSADDGRRTLVDLTKTLTEMSQHGKLAPDEISAELIDAEISESVMGEPDLLVLFGESVVLQGYPPWQVRLTEVFHVQDNTGVGYQVFLRALHKYAKVQMRFGR